MISAAGFFAPARAEMMDVNTEYQIYMWPKWQKGFDLGTRAFGRFGAGSNLNTPPGDWLVQGTYHLWLNHIFEMHGSFGLGIINGTMSYGVGAKLNLIEFIEDPSSDMMMRGLQRGALSKVLKNFMLVAGVDYLHLGFREPASGLTYEASAWKIIPSFGAQWFFYIPQNFAGRFYIETSIGYTALEGSNYFLPVFSLGAELL